MFPFHMYLMNILKKKVIDTHASHEIVSKNCLTPPPLKKSHCCNINHYTYDVCFYIHIHYNFCLLVITSIIRIGAFLATDLKRDKQQPLLRKHMVHTPRS